MQEQGAAPVKAFPKAEIKKTNPYFTMGTPQCGLLLAIVGFILALLLIFLGFWRMVLVALFAGIGYFIGRNKNKAAAVKRFINRMITPKAD